MNKKLVTLILIIFFTVLTIINNNGQVKGIYDGQLAVYFLDVGQGDATLIRTPLGDDILIDGGPSNTLIQKLGKYLPFYDHKIETIILTHPDSDHVTGLVEVIKRYDVDRVLMTKVIGEATGYKSFLSEVAKNNINVEIIDQAKLIDFGGGVTFDVLYPLENLAGQEVENTNNTSITGKLIYASTTVMLTGDLENEEDLVLKGLDLKSDIYHVGHHGSSNANDLSFVLAVDPEYAIISVGANNSYGHPNYRTLKNLEKVEAEIFRTDELGDIIFYSDGQKFQYYSLP